MKSSPVAGVPLSLIVAVPWLGPEVTESMFSVWLLSLLGPGVSLARTWTLTEVSSAVVALSLFATGASLTAVTVRVTVATLLSAVPSLALYVKLSVPLKLAAGLYVNEPFALRVSVPWIGPLTGRGVPTVRLSPSTSVSLARTPGAATVSGGSSEGRVGKEGRSRWSLYD